MARSLGLACVACRERAIHIPSAFSVGHFCPLSVILALPLVAIAQDYSTQNIPLIAPKPRLALFKKWAERIHLTVGQPEKVASHHSTQVGSLTYAARTASSKSMCPDPRKVDG